MESFDSLSGLESLRRPPGTGWPPSLPASAADVGLGTDHHGDSFRAELRRNGTSQAVAERTESGRRHSERIADRRASRPASERSSGPQKETENPAAGARRVEERKRLERTEEALAPTQRGVEDRPVPTAPRRGLDVHPAPEVSQAPERTLAPTSTPTIGVPVQVPGAAPADRSAPPGPAPVASPPRVPQAPVASPTRDSATPTGRVSAPRPTPDLRRAAEVLDQLKAAIRPGLRRAVVQLEPGDLGTVTIRIAVARGSVSGRIEVERPETLELVERHAPELRAALADAGLEVGELDVALGRDSGASNPGEAADGQRPAGSQRAPAAEPTEHRSSPRPTRLDPDGVDFYA